LIANGTIQTENCKNAYKIKSKVLQGHSDIRYKNNIGFQRAEKNVFINVLLSFGRNALYPIEFRKINALNAIPKWACSKNPVAPSPMISPTFRLLFV